MKSAGRVLAHSALLLGVGWAYGPAPGLADTNVVASIKPVHSLVAGVMQGVGEPVLLVKGASSPHSYSLRPSEARALEQARVVFWIGERLESYLAKPLRALSAAALVVALSEADGVRLLATREGGVWQKHAPGERGEETHAARAENEREAPAEADHAEEAEHEELEQEDDEHPHEDGQFDMHIWLDPHNAAAMVDAIVAALSDADSANASTYRDNGGALRQRLKQLDEALGAELASVGDRPFVVFHDAYQYLEERYGLNAVGTISVDPGRRPGAQRLVEIQRRLDELNAACVFAEPQFEPALVDTVIEGTGAKQAVLDPLGADLEAGPDQYFQLMDGLADSLIDCLGQGR